ncbi:MAG: hypothetical protein FD151_2253 [bacterium]|nr:MAG: hypothetical protein FD151_2253 [bacterium]
MELLVFLLTEALSSFFEKQYRSHKMDSIPRRQYSIYLKKGS